MGSAKSSFVGRQSSNGGVLTPKGCRETSKGTARCSWFRHSPSPPLSAIVARGAANEAPCRAIVERLPANVEGLRAIARPWRANVGRVVRTRPAIVRDRPPHAREGRRVVRNLGSFGHECRSRAPKSSRSKHTRTTSWTPSSRSTERPNCNHVWGQSTPFDCARRLMRLMTWDGFAPLEDQRRLLLRRHPPVRRHLELVRLRAGVEGPHGQDDTSFGRSGCPGLCVGGDGPQALSIGA
jgi:hypothetical protein